MITTFKKFSLKDIITILLTIALVWFLINQIDDLDKLHTLYKIPATIILLTFFIYTFTYLLRAIRWKILLPSRKLTLLDLSAVSSIHILFNNLLPGRIGELTYPYLLKNKFQIPLEESMATLIIARIFDLISIILIFLISVLSFPSNIFSVFQKYNYLAIIALIASVTILVFLPDIFSLISKSLVKISKTGYLKESNYINLLIDKIFEFTKHLNRIYSPLVYLKVLTVSLLHWSCTFGICYLVIYGIMNELGKETEILSVSQVVFGTAAAELSTVLPIHGLAGFGTFEGFWTAAFVLIGIDQSLAILTGFGYHILFLIYSIILGAAGSLTFAYKRIELRSKQFQQSY